MIKKEKSVWYENGKKKTGYDQPNGLYHAIAPDYANVLVDPNYNGFKVIYFKIERASISCSGPHGIMDTIELKSMADGKMYDSRSQYYESLKRNDSRIIEAGELEAHKKSMREVRGDFNCRKELKQAIEQHLH